MKHADLDKLQMYGYEFLGWTRRQQCGRDAGWLIDSVCRWLHLTLVTVFTANGNQSDVISLIKTNEVVVFPQRLAFSLMQEQGLPLSALP